MKIFILHLQELATKKIWIIWVIVWKWDHQQKPQTLQQEGSVAADKKQQSEVPNKPFLTQTKQFPT